jgi:hypothetical protein
MSVDLKTFLARIDALDTPRFADVQQVCADARLIAAELERARKRIDALIVHCANVAFDAIMDDKGPISVKDAILSIKAEDVKP